MWWWWHKIPCLIGNKSPIFFLHTKLSIWIREGTSICFWELTDVCCNRGQFEDLSRLTDSGLALGLHGLLIDSRGNRNNRRVGGALSSRDDSRGSRRGWCRRSQSGWCRRRVLVAPVDLHDRGPLDTSRARRPCRIMNRRHERVAHPYNKIAVAEPPEIECFRGRSSSTRH